MSTFFVVYSDGELEAYDSKIEAERAANGKDCVVICGKMINAKASKYSTPLHAGGKLEIEEEVFTITEE